MATQAIPGYNARVYISNDGGGTFPEIGEMQDVELHVQATMADATSHASAGAKEFVPTLVEWDATAGFLYISSNAAQDNIEAALRGKTLLQFRFDPENTAVGKERWTGSGYIKDWKNTGKTADLAVCAIQIQGSGALTKVTQ